MPEVAYFWFQFFVFITQLKVERNEKNKKGRDYVLLIFEKEDLTLGGHGYMVHDQNI